MSIKFLYFDIGNVLLSFSHQRMCRQMAEVAGVATEAVARALFEAEGVSEIQRQHETGTLSSDAFYEHFCTQVETRPNRARLEFAASDIFEPIDTVHSLVQRLSAAGLRLGLLSNTNEIHWDFMTDGRFPLLEAPAASASRFEVAVASHQVGAMKPDAAIYRVAIERTGLEPGEIFFVDDRPENVAAAQEHGIDAVRFSDVDTLRDDLEVRGLVAG